MTLDIHDYDARYAEAAARVRASTISERNKALIFAYRDACLLRQVCSKVRLIRVMGVLDLAARALGKDFDTATREELEHLIGTWMTRRPAYSAETLGTYKSMLKRFYTWLADPQGFSSRTSAPALVAWITPHVRTKDKKRLQRNELLTPGEVQRALDACRTSRDRALLSVLWETGGRIAEIGNRELNDVVPSSVGYTLEVDGKTGVRSPLLVSSAPHLAAWLNHHPRRNEPTAPLWVREDGARHLQYPALRKVLSDRFRAAGITKRVYPHLFRHSRATYVLATGIMTEAQAKAYFGWSPNTTQLATYAHLLASDANNAILRENHLAPVAAKAEDLVPVSCWRCGQQNPHGADYCTRCTAVLDAHRAYERPEEASEQLLARLLQLLTEHGLSSDAARLIRDAGMGHVVAHVAQQPLRKA